MALAVRSSDFMETLNRQTLKVAGLTDGKYTLIVDGSEVGTFTNDRAGRRRESGRTLDADVGAGVAAARAHAEAQRDSLRAMASLQVPLESETPHWRRPRWMPWTESSGS